MLLHRIHAVFYATMIVLSWMLVPHTAYCQKKVVLEEGNPSQQIGKFIYYIEDKDKKFHFNNILSHKHDHLFKKSEQDAPNFGNVELTTWNKFTVLNRSNTEWYLVVENYNLDTLYFFAPDTQSRYRQIRSGRSLPVSQRKYKSGAFVFDLHVPRGDSAVFYLRVSSHFMQYPLHVVTKEKFIEIYHKRDRLEGFYYGLLFFMVLYFLILYFSAREKSYLYNVLYILFNGLMIAQLKGSIAEFWGDQFHFLWRYAPVTIAITSSATFIFTMHVLETKKHTPLSHRILTYIFLPLCGLAMLLSLLNKNLYASLLNQVSGLAGLITMYVTAIIIARKGFRFARFYIAACWAYFAGVTIYVLKAFNLIPHNTFTNSAIEIGSTIQMIVLSFTLAAKINTYKRERAKAQSALLHSLQENEQIITNQNKLLETKVNERTAELKNTLTALEQFQQELESKNRQITHEKELSDHLLLNILPAETAKELKEKGYAEARMYDDVTVLFTDFKDFTAITEHMRPAELVAELDYCFRAFDNIIDKYGIEKIKTIGDSYMAAAGLPVRDKEGAVKTVRAAMDILLFMQTYNADCVGSNRKPLQIRIGIHTGSVVAGIVGTRKFAYDIWGDTVNTASRMESSGTEGKINISEDTYQQVKGYFECTHRGKIQVKSKGLTDMYYIRAFKTQPV